MCTYALTKQFKINLFLYLKYMTDILMYVRTNLKLIVCICISIQVFEMYA